MSPPHDAVVVGAGPAGSATAILLARRGAKVVLFDRATFPRPKPCAEYVGPGAVRMLTALGVHPTPAMPVLGMRIVAPDGTTATGTFGGPEGLAIPRELLDAQLVEAAARAGAEVRTGEAVSDIPKARQLGHLLIGADGMHSRVARQTVGQHAPTSARMALVTHYADVPDLTDHGEMHVTAFGYVGLAPVGPNLANVAVVVDGRREQPAEDATAWFESLVARVPTLKDRLGAGRRVDRVRGIGPFGRRARRAHAERLMLVGDAAEFYDPFTGDGIWAALKGAELAADAAEHPDDLARYDRARRRAFLGKWVVERSVIAAVGRPRLFNRVNRLLAWQPRLLDTLVRTTGHA